MFKKIILMLVIASLLVTPVSATETLSEETSAAALTREQEMLVALDIMSPDSYGLIDNAKEITRVEFASSVAKIVDVNPTVVATSTYYDDVAADGWAAHTLNNLVDMKILNVPADKMFRPNDKILFSEAVKMLVCLLGYGNYAENMGGYPTGYIAAANRIDLLDGVDAAQNVTTGMLSQLLYNALHTKMLDIESIGREIEYTNTTGVTLLSSYHGIYMTEGVVEAIEGLTISGKETSAGKCIIDGVSYFTNNVNANKYIGYFVKAYYKDSGENTRTLIYLDAYENDTFTILSEDYVGYDNGEITFYNDKAREKTEKIRLSGTFVRNGSVVTKNLDKSVDITNGEIRLIDNDLDGKYDVVFIEDYQTIVVKSISLMTMIIVDDIVDKNAIDIDVDNLFIYNAQGNETNLESIKAGMVLDVGVGDNSVVIHISTNTFDGEISSVKASSHKIEIDGVEYDCYKSAYKRYGIDANKKGNFKTNRYGKIAYFKEGEIANLPGYLIDIDNSSGLGSTQLFKILTKDGEIKIFSAANPIKVDNEKCTGDLTSKFTTKLGGVTTVNKGVIIYALNSKGEITYIDTPTNIYGGETFKNNEDEASLKIVGETNENTHYWYNTDRKWGKQYLLSADVVVFRVPLDESIADDDDYGVVDLASLETSGRYNSTVYKLGKSSECNIVALKNTKYIFKTTSPYNWVKEVRKGVNEDGESVTRLIVYERGAEKTITIEDDYSIVPDVGDLIRVGVDDKGMCGMVAINYDYDKRTDGPVDPLIKGEHTLDWWKTYDYIHHENRLVVGHAVSVDGDILEIGNDKIGSENVAEVFRVPSATPLIIYNEEENEFMTGTLGDIMPSEIYGIDCSEVIIYTRYAKPLAVYVMNNRDKTGLQ